MIEIYRLQESRVSELRSSDANILSQNANGRNAKRHRHIEYDIANPHKPETTTYHDSYATALPDSRHLGKLRLILKLHLATPNIQSIVYNIAMLEKTKPYVAKEPSVSRPNA